MSTGRPRSGVPSVRGADRALMAVWLILAVAITALVMAGPRDGTLDSPPDPGTEPPAIAGQGYAKVFEDNFDKFDKTKWKRDIFYEHDDPVDQAYVRDGALVLETRRSTNYIDVQVETEDKHSWKYGYFECRSKFSSGPGAQPACWLLSQRWANNPSCTTPAAEIDIFEGQSVDRFYWIGALHRHSGQHVADCGGNRINSNAFQAETFPVADTWHTWAAKWTPEEVCWYLDDALSHCTPVWDTTNISPMFLILWISAPGWREDNKIAADSPDVLTNETDWVRVWQRTSATPARKRSMQDE